jgi:hypothetical protein
VVHEADIYARLRVRQLSDGQQDPVTGKPPNIRSFPLAGLVARGSAGKPPPAGTPPAKVAEDLTRAAGPEQDTLVEYLRDGKGVADTEALASVLSRLGGAVQHKAGEALVLRMARMKAATLSNYLGDEDPWIRGAAARACVLKGLKGHVPQLIPLLRDPDQIVTESAYVNLQQLTGLDLGRNPAAWEAWWKKQGKN